MPTGASAVSTEMSITSLPSARKVLIKYQGRPDSTFFLRKKTIQQSYPILQALGFDHFHAIVKSSGLLDFDFFSKQIAVFPYPMKCIG